MDIGKLDDIRNVFANLADPAARIARFSYTERAFVYKEIAGKADYDFNRDQNIPLATATDTNPMVLDKGIRTQGASIARNFQNHFTGRVSYNLNMVVDTLLLLVDWVQSFLPKNLSIYHPEITYFPGDMAFFVTNTASGAQVVYTAYRRNNNNPNGTKGIPPTDALYWTIMREETSLARAIQNVDTLDLNDLLQTGVYSLVTPDTVVRIKNFPPIQGNPNLSCIIRVAGDINNTDIIIQECIMRDGAIQWMRSLAGSTVVQDWYKGVDPGGMTIIGVPGLWVFKIDLRGHLMLYHDAQVAPPPLHIDFNPNTIEIIVEVYNDFHSDLTIPTQELTIEIGNTYAFKITTPLVVPTHGTAQLACRANVSGDTDTGLPANGTDITTKIFPPLAHMDLKATLVGKQLVSNLQFGHLIWTF